MFSKREREKIIFWKLIIDEIYTNFSSIFSCIQTKISYSHPIARDPRFYKIARLSDYPSEVRSVNLYKKDFCFHLMVPISGFFVSWGFSF